MSACSSSSSSSSASYSSSIQLPKQISLRQALGQFSVSIDIGEQIVTKLQETTQRAAEGALKTSCARSYRPEKYFRKSVNKIPFPVFQNHEGLQFTIVKIRLRDDFDPKGAFAKGACKNVYIALKLDAGKGDRNAILKEPIYAWGRSKYKIFSPYEATEAIRIRNEMNVYRMRAEPEFYRTFSGDQSLLYYGHCEFAIDGKIENQRVGILMEFCPETLIDWVIKGKALKYSFVEMCEFLKKHLELLKLLQEKKVQHHDIKLENIMMDADGNPKLSDYGLAVDLSRDQLFQRAFGSPLYALPEEAEVEKELKESIPRLPADEYLTKGYEMCRTAAQKVHTPKGDIYMMGIVFYAICFNCHPWNDGVRRGEKYDLEWCKTLIENPVFLKAYVKSKLDSREKMTYQCARFTPLIRGMLEFNPDDRFDLSQCFTTLEAIKQSKS